MVTRPPVQELLDGDTQTVWKRLVFYDLVRYFLNNDQGNIVVKNIILITPLSLKYGTLLLRFLLNMLGSISGEIYADFCECGNAMKLWISFCTKNYKIFMNVEIWV
jgi:hypothetical protein